MAFKNRSFSSLLRIGFFYFVGLSIFFTTAFLIVSFRISYKGEVEVPSLTGKMYLDEHNRLKEVGFNVELEKSHSVEYPYGYIFSQSLTPGDVVKSGQKLTLSVNYSKVLVETPKLISFSFSLAPKILSNVYSDGRRYKLNIGVVTRIPSKYSKGEILAQYPLYRTPVIPEYPVSLLVSLGSSGKGSKDALLPSTREINRLNIEIIKRIAYHLGIPLDISISPTTDYKKDGSVLDSAPLKRLFHQNQGSTWKVRVAKYQWEGENKDGNREHPFRFVWLGIDDLGIQEGSYSICKLRPADLPDHSKDDEHSIFSYIAFERGKTVPFFKSLDDEELLIWKDLPVISKKNCRGETNLKEQPLAELPKNLSAEIEPMKTYILR